MRLYVVRFAIAKEQDARRWPHEGDRLLEALPVIVEKLRRQAPLPPVTA